MIPAIEYYRPTTMNDALHLLAEHQGQARILAGGTDIIPGFQQETSRFQDVKVLVDINRISDLKKIDEKDGNIIIGAGVTFAEVMTNQTLNQNFPLLAKAAATIGSVQIRNRATLAGNFINNAPCADSVPPLLVYNAKIKIASLQHQREELLENFLLKPYRTAIQPDELVTQIVIPILPDMDNYVGDFYKLGRRRAVAVSRITLSYLISLKDSTIHDFRISSGAVTPIGVRFHELESFAIGKELNNDLRIQLSQQLGQKIIAITGLRWSSPYKVPVVQQMFYQLLNQIQTK